MCFDRNINGNRDVKFLGCHYVFAWAMVRETYFINIIHSSLERQHYNSFPDFTPSSDITGLDLSLLKDLFVCLFTFRTFWNFLDPFESSGII